LAIRHVLLSDYWSACSNDYLTCWPLSPFEKHINSNCLECLAHGRVCFRGYMEEKASNDRMVFGVFFA